MNIKNLLGLNTLVTPVARSATADRPIKSQASQERDANGQEFYSKQQKKEKMSAEQFKKALELLKEKPFMKELNWVVIAHHEDGLQFAWVQDQSGNTIRKIAEYDLWEIFDTTSQIPNKGQLLKKTA